MNTGRECEISAMIIDGMKKKHNVAKAYDYYPRHLYSCPAIVSYFSLFFSRRIFSTHCSLFMKEYILKKYTRVSALFVLVGLSV